jgi:hypothetical protein
MKKNKNVSVSVFQFILCVYEALHTILYTWEVYTHERNVLIKCCQENVHVRCIILNKK